MMRGPNINIAPRAVAVDHAIPAVGRLTLSARMAVRPQFPNLRTSPNLSPSCGGPARDANGQCIDVLADSDGNGGTGRGKTKTKVAARAAMPFRRGFSGRPFPTRSSPRSTAR